MKNFKQELGIIYRIYSSGADDRIVLIINESGAKVPLLVKGAKKPSSRKSYSLELGNKIKVKTITGYAVPILSDVKLLDENRDWKKDYKNSIFLQFFCELIDRFCNEDLEDEDLYGLFNDVLSSTGPDLNFVSAIFLIKLLQITGNLPKLNECFVSGEKIGTDSCYFYDGLGYVSADYSPTKERVPERIYKTQRYAEHSSLKEVLKVNLSPEEAKQMLRIHLGWMEFVLERELKSQKLLLSVMNK